MAPRLLTKCLFKSEKRALNGKKTLKFQIKIPKLFVGFLTARVSTFFVGFERKKSVLCGFYKGENGISTADFEKPILFSTNDWFLQ